MPLSTDLPTTRADGDPDHTDDHNTTNTRVNAIAGAVNGLAMTGVTGKAVRVYANSTGQSYSNFQLATVDLNATDFNTDTSLFDVDLTANTITVSQAGLYLVMAQVKAGDAGATGQRYAGIQISGFLGRETGATYSGVTTVAVLGVISLAADDDLSLSFYTDNALTLVTTPDFATGITVALLGT